MKFGLDKTTKERIEANPGLHANCPCCEKELIAKCGKIKVHHWAHKSVRGCDPWWEPETEWHRKWKNKFPRDWQEVVKHSKSGEKHIADIYNPKMDLVIEFQNSPIDIEEMESRESFYGRMLWVVNAEKFDFSTSSLGGWSDEIKIRERRIILATSNYKPPTYDLLEKKMNLELELRIIEKDIISGKITKEEGETRKRGIESQIIEYFGNYSILGSKTLASLKKERDEIDKYINENKTKEDDEHFVRYKWSRRRKVWDMAKCPVFFDFGNKLVWVKSTEIAKGVRLDRFIKKYNE